jgi:hypothetical protein
VVLALILVRAIAAPGPDTAPTPAATTETSSGGLPTGLEEALERLEEAVQP